MTRKTLDAVYENGVFRLLSPQQVALPEGQHVRLLVESIEPTHDVLVLAARVYAGLSEEEIAEVEQIAFDRRALFSEREDG
jgi:predicted DNA-binding antitoxin AbrB/MazE fold protein